VVKKERFFTNRQQVAIQLILDIANDSAKLEVMTNDSRSTSWFTTCAYLFKYLSFIQELLYVKFFCFRRSHSMTKQSFRAQPTPWAYNEDAVLPILACQRGEFKWVRW